MSHNTAPESAARGFGNWTSGKGEAFLKVNWQIYSRLDRKVIYETITEGSNKVGDSSPTGPTDVFLSAFSLATQNLLADEGFNDLVAGITVADTKPAQQKLFIVKAGLYRTPINEHINDVRSGVVTILAEGGHGSGFFISPDGYILTNAHVVGGAKSAKIKLATNREILGEVLRIDNRRDLALIKTEESQMALPLNLNQPNVGEDVYAIGTPLDESLRITFICR